MPPTWQSRYAAFLAGSVVQLILSFHEPIVEAASLQQTAQAFAVLQSESKTRNNQKDSLVPSAIGFPQWFEDSHRKTFVHPAILVCDFPTSGKGIAWHTDDDDSSVTRPAMIARVPKSMVLQADYTRRDWDVQLAVQLLNVMTEEQTMTPSGSSIFHGYIKSLPAKPAPHTIRHWTSNQRERLKGTDAGRRLVQAADQQVRRWRESYNRLYHSDTSVGWKTFEWAMETVNSRAFCGLSNTRGIFMRSFGAPLISAGVVCGMATFADLSSIGDATALLALFGISSALPTAYQFVQKKQRKLQPDLVYLIPLFDFVNHKDDVTTSRIDWDPLQQHFSLYVGPDCFIKEQDYSDAIRTQIYINYGEKDDMEWLLNFGFLPSMASSENAADASSDDDLRQRLAKEFVHRNR